MKYYYRSLFLASGIMALNVLQGNPLSEFPKSDTKTPAAMIGGHFSLWVTASSDPESMQSGTEMILTFMDDAVMLSFFDTKGNHQQILLSITGYFIESDTIVFELHYLSTEGSEQRLRLRPEGSELSTGTFTMTNSPQTLGFQDVVGTFSYKAP